MQCLLSVLIQPEFVVVLKTPGGRGGGIHPLKEKMFYEVIIIMYGGTLNPGIVEGQWQT